ncbi:hypothetical protein ACLB2K_071119 [Fragaria x ananassa]
MPGEAVDLENRGGVKHRANRESYSSSSPGIQGKCVARVLGKFSFQPLKENPLFGPSSSTLEKLGALEWFKVVHKHQGWRLVTCIWLHAGVVHLVVNMLSLVFIGIRIEQQFGFGIYFSVILNISVGASGALFGLLGSMLSELITNWTIYTNKVAALVTLLVITLNLPADANANVKSKFKANQYVLWLLSVTLLIVGFTVALVMLFRGENGNEHCHWFHYLSCIPTSRWHCEEN